MNEQVTDPSGDATDAELDNPALDNPESNDDNSIRELLAAQLESDDPPAAEEGSSDDESEKNGAETPTVEDDPLAPPQSWTAAEREAWQDLPDTARDAITRREKEYQAGLKSDAELQKVIEPLAEQLDGTGVHVDQYVNGLLQADRYIDQNPLQAVQTLIQKYNLADQLNLPANAAPQTPQGDSDDRVAQLEQQIRYQAEVTAETQKWNSFVAEHPDAPQYAEVMASKIQANPQLTYQSAYDQAVELVTGVAKTSKAAQEAARINGQTAAANKANKLNLPKGKTGVNAPVESSGSVRDDLLATARKAGLNVN